MPPAQAVALSAALRVIRSAEATSGWALVARILSSVMGDHRLTEARSSR
jgi:hypothetical protein